MIPSVESVTGHSVEHIFTLTPRHLHYNEYMWVFGMTLSTGIRKIGGAEVFARKTANIPTHLTKIEVVFRKDEYNIHHMVFHGETTVHIGRTKQEDEMFKVGERAGRVERVTLAPGEELLGCEMHHDHSIRGLTFLIKKAL
jgi:hypothetical protein